MSARLTVDEVATQLHVKPETVCRWAAAGDLRGFKVGRRWLFHQDDVDAFVESGKNRAQQPARRRRRRAA
jgi:excisionase family DNA binding protein